MENSPMTRLDGVPSHYRFVLFLKGPMRLHKKSKITPEVVDFLKHLVEYKNMTLSYAAKSVGISYSSATVLKRLSFDFEKYREYVSQKAASGRARKGPSLSDTLGVVLAKDIEKALKDKDIAVEGEKIIQFQYVHSTLDVQGGLFALTDAGRMFFLRDHTDTWVLLVKKGI